ncbi:ATPase, P-type (transporting), HAD superfamily, subfamily IC [Cichlidogyrus casuarinus]|uniref:P-type Ca(2+) transporter n=1 Tax=Cichlidogyrus casuarinus TaxID=1844966 RepID=A0ABD2PWR6_9PLAT
MEVEKLLSQLQVNAATGLSFSEASNRRLNFGPNEFDVSEDEPQWKKFLDQFKEPMILLLLGSAAVSLIIGEVHDAASIALAITIVCTVAFIQNYRSEKALESLKMLMPPNLRDNNLHEFNASELVPGDIVILSVGDRIPADLRLFDCSDLQVDESTLTGEVDPVRKHSQSILLPRSKTFATLHADTHSTIHPTQTFLNMDVQALKSTRSHISAPLDNLGFDDREEHVSPLEAPKHSAHDLLNIGFMGTLVRGGHAKGVVIATAKHSTFGEVFTLMQSEESPRTPLQRGMDLLGKQLTMISMVIIIVIVIFGLIQHRSLLELFNVAIPEGLPIVVTVTLAIGQIRMASRNAIVKKLPAVETLGCVNVICTDKTGTITKNEMTVTKVVTSGLERVSVTGVGYSPLGGKLIWDMESSISVETNGNLRRLIEVGFIDLWVLSNSAR